MSGDERESQLSAMFDGELPDPECELLARRLSRDAGLKQQWARYALVGAVIRDEPLRARRDPGGRLAAGIAGRLAVALEAEPPAGAEPGPGTEPAPAAAPSATRLRWARPAAGVAIAASVAALSVFWLQGRTPESPGSNAASPLSASAPVAPREVEVIAPPAATRGAATEVVVAGYGYPALAPVDRGPGSGEPESYVVPPPSARPGSTPPTQLANYVVAHSEFSGPLSRRSLLSALVASDPTAAPVVAPAPVVPEGDAAGAGAGAAMPAPGPATATGRADREAGR